MSEEAVVETGGVVDQEAMANDYFSAYDLVDDSGDDVPVDESAGDADEPEASEPVADAQPKTEDAKNAEPVEDESDSQEPQQAKQPEPKGFDAGFWTTDESGTSVFDSEAALKFSVPENGPADFEYGSRDFQEKPAEQEAGSPDAPKDEFEALYEEKDALQSNAFKWRNELDAVLKENPGISLEQAAAIADSRVQEHLSKEYKRMDYEHHKAQNDRFKSDIEAHKSSQVQKEKAYANMSRFMSRFKDESQYKEFVFGVGNNWLNQLYDMMNPGKANGMTQESLTKDMGDWWTNVMADSKQYDFAMKSIMGQWVLKNLSSIIGNVQASKDAGEVELAKGKRSTPSRIQRSEATGDTGGKNSVEEFFGMKIGADGKLPLV